MKYAAICSYGSPKVNIGDYMFFLSVYNIYKQMGIPYNEVYKLSLEDVFTYDGEELILPFNHALTQFTKNAKIAISPKIKPVFLAAVLPTVTNYTDTDLFFKSEYNLNYLLRHSPIGCRDITTYEILTSYNIPAYVNGCLTAAFPPVENLSGKHIILADAPKDLLSYIPKNLLEEKPLITTQQFFLPPDIINDFDKTFDFVKEKYKFYTDNAKLIITSRLHVALPCAAFGVPVILAKDIIDSRFSFLENYIPVHDRLKYSTINWHPQPCNFEKQKAKLIKLNKSRILGLDNCSNLISDLNNAFLKNSSSNFIDPHLATNANVYRIENYIKTYWKTDRQEKYALWGVTDKTANIWKLKIEELCPKAQLTTIFDRYSKESLFGILKSSPDDIINLPSDTKIIVCAVSAVEDALELFEKHNIPPERYCIVADQFISVRDI